MNSNCASKRSAITARSHPPRARRRACLALLVALLGQASCAAATPWAQAWAAIPAAQHDRVACSIEAALRYRIPVDAMLAIAQQEGGRPDLWSKNRNGSFDIGAMQFNTRYLAELSRYGISAADVAQAGCYPYELAAWRLRGHLLYDHGDAWTRIADYHSRTPLYNAAYRRAIIHKARYWARWLSTYFNTSAYRP